MERRVAIVEHRGGADITCEVIYWKDTEAPGVREVLWAAKTDAGYCDSKALGLVSKLGSIGWSCGSFASAEE